MTDTPTSCEPAMAAGITPGDATSPSGSALTLADLENVATAEQALELGMKIELRLSYDKAIKAAWEECMLRLIRQFGDIEFGTVRYYEGVDKTTKARDAQAVLEALLDKCGGDLKLLCECLASGCWKPGAIKTVIDDPKRFDELFKTTVKTDLKTGVPKKGLKRIDSRFLRE